MNEISAGTEPPRSNKEGIDTLETPNPYSYVPGEEVKDLGAAAPSALPTFAMVMMIISLVFFVIRVPIVALSCLAIAMLKDDPFFFMAILEAVTGALMALFGITGNSLVLAKKPLGIPLCWLAVAATVGSILVGVAQVPAQFGKFAADSPEFIGAMVGLVLFGGIRIAILVAYIFAIVMAGRALRSINTSVTARD